MGRDLSFLFFYKTFQGLKKEEMFCFIVFFLWCVTGSYIDHGLHTWFLYPYSALTIPPHS